MQAQTPIRRRILASLSALVGFVVVAFVMTVYLVEWRRREEDVEALTRSVEAMFQQRVEAASGLMQASAAAMQLSGALQTALAAHDSKALADLAGPLFETLRRDHRVTHLYFEAPDGSVLVRLHDRNTFGDRIERATLRRAAATGAPAAGLEMGPLGTLTLRTVTPWRRDGATLGFIEIGEEVGPMLGDIAASLDVRLFALVDERLIDRAAWEQGRRALGRSGDLLLFGDHVLVSQSGAEPAPGERALLSELPREGAARLVNVDGRKQAVAGRPIIDAAGRRVGTLAIFAIRDRAAAEFNLWVATALLLSLAAAAVVFFSFNKALAGVDADYRRRHELELQLLRISSEHQRLVQIEKLSAMGAMIGEIAHQLNNPLVGVINMAQLAERSADRPDRVRALLAEILLAGRSCSDFVKRMLHFSKASRFESRPCDLRSVVEEACALFRQSTGRRTRVDIHVPDGPARVVGDANLLANALFNLLTNAAQAMGEGGRAIVTLAPAAGEGGQPGWSLSVADEGPGVPADVMPKLFTPFFTTRKEGTGLGLAVALHIALLHEGAITAANRQDGGAIFTLWSPAAPAA